MRSGGTTEIFFSAMAEHDTLKPADFAEKTKPQFQTRGGVAGIFMDGATLGAPAPATFETYRKMRSNPTLALARAVATAPIRTAPIQAEAVGETPEERTAFVGDHFTGLWPKLVADMVRAIEFGFQPFEKVFEISDGLIRYGRVKPLLPDATVILIDKDTGQFTGLRNKNIDLLVAKSFIYTHDQEGDDFYGRSRNENVREHAWTPWNDLAKRLRQFAGKVAGITAMVEYPDGQTEDANGTLIPNFEHAKTLLANLGKGDGVAMPNVFSKFAGDLARAGIDIGALQAWKISFLEASGRHIVEFINGLRYYDSLLLRGYLVPERAAIEGQFGTKAEAGTHGALALVMANLTLQEMLAAVNDQLVNPLLRLNWGDEAVGTVRIVSAGLEPLTRAFFRSLVDKVLSAPDNIFLLQDLIDLPALASEAGLPVKAKAGAAMSRTPERRSTDQIHGLMQAVLDHAYDGIAGDIEDGGAD